jgi:hypothetical protein
MMAAGFMETAKFSMTMKWMSALCALGFLALAGCASTPNTFSQSDPTADFASYQTYAFYDEPATDNAQYESLVTNFLKVSVAQQLDARGMTYDPADPDVVVNFFLNTKEKVRSRQVPTMSGYYGWRDPFYDPWPGYAYETRIDQYTEGTLNIDVADVAQKKLVWEGSVVGRITDDFVRNLERGLDEAVAAIFENYPVERLYPIKE